MSFSSTRCKFQISTGFNGANINIQTKISTRVKHLHRMKVSMKMFVKLICTTNNLCRIIECEKCLFILKDNTMIMIDLYLKIAD